MSEHQEIVNNAAENTQAEMNAEKIFKDKIIKDAERELAAKLEGHILSWFKGKLWVVSVVIVAANIVFGFFGYTQLSTYIKDTVTSEITTAITKEADNVQKSLKNQEDKVAFSNQLLQTIITEANKSSVNARDAAGKAANAEELTKNYLTEIQNHLSAIRKDKDAVEKEVKNLNENRKELNAEIDSLKSKLEKASKEYVALVVSLGKIDAELDKVVVKQFCIPLDKKQNGRKLYKVILSLDIDDAALNEEEKQRILGKIEKVQYRFDVKYFNPSERIVSDTTSGFQTETTIWGETEFTVELISKLPGRSKVIKDRLRIDE